MHPQALRVLPAVHVRVLRLTFCLEASHIGLEEEPDCTCEQTDVDQVDARYCGLHGTRYPKTLYWCRVCAAPEVVEIRIEPAAELVAANRRGGGLMAAHLYGLRRCQRQWRRPTIRARGGLSSAGSHLRGYSGPGWLEQPQTSTSNTKRAHWAQRRKSREALKRQRSK